MRDLILILLGMAWTVASLFYAFYLRDLKMQDKESFDFDQPDHLLMLASMLDHVLNEERGDVRFVLLVWKDDHDDIQGLVSNDKSDKHVVGMLDDAKMKIKNASVIHSTPGHA